MTRIIEKLLPVLFLLMWGSGAIFVKLGLEYSSVIVFLLIRSTGSCILLFIVYVVFFRKKDKITGVKIIQAMLLGMILQVGYQLTFFLALDYNTAPGTLAIILGMQPIITSFFSSEKTGREGYFFLFIGFIGLILAIMGSKVTGNINIYGVIFGFLSVLSISFGSLMQKKIMINPLESAFYQSLSAAIVFALIVPFMENRLDLSPVFLISAGWMIVVVSTLAVLVLFYMLSTTSAGKVSVLFYLTPVVTLFFDYFVFSNKLSMLTIIGACIVVVSIKFFISSQKKV